MQADKPAEGPTRKARMQSEDTVKRKAGGQNAMLIRNTVQESQCWNFKVFSSHSEKKGKEIGEIYARKCFM